jgi:hypothetical protein
MPAFKNWVLSRDYSFLLALLLVYLVLYPYLEGRGSGKELFLELLFFTTLAMVVDKLHPKKSDLITGIVFALAIWSIEFCITFHMKPFGDATDLVQTILTLLFYAFATVVSLIFVLRPKSICHETLAAAAFAYLMLGITWGQAYQLIHLTVPSSFFVNMTNDLDKTLTWTDFLYFSFATMTSTGYGDLTAVTSQSRSLASLEALVGQFYMAVVVARLVGIYQIAPMVVAVEPKPVQSEDVA